MAHKLCINYGDVTCLTHPFKIPLNNKDSNKDSNKDNKPPELALVKDYELPKTR